MLGCRGRKGGRGGNSSAICDRAVDEGRNIRRRGRRRGRRKRHIPKDEEDPEISNRCQSGDLLYCTGSLGVLVTSKSPSGGGMDRGHVDAVFYRSRGQRRERTFYEHQRIQPSITSSSPSLTTRNKQEIITTPLKHYLQVVLCFCFCFVTLFCGSLCLQSPAKGDGNCLKGL